jgi:hypothetical protein
MVGRPLVFVVPAARWLPSPSRMSAMAGSGGSIGSGFPNRFHVELSIWRDSSFYISTRHCYRVCYQLVGLVGRGLVVGVGRKLMGLPRGCPGTTPLGGPRLKPLLPSRHPADFSALTSVMPVKHGLPEVSEVAGESKRAGR